MQAMRPVFMGEPEPGRPADEDFVSGYLEQISSVGALEWLLRDIFSLKHVEDWSVRDLPHGPSQPPPPDGGRSGGAQANLLFEETVAQSSRRKVNIPEEEWFDQEIYMKHAHETVIL